MINLNIKKLNNGLTIITDNIENYNSVAIKLWIKTGSRAETKENNGIAHFLEHMAFKGTTSRSAIDIAKEFDELGGNFNAATSREYTVYYLKVLNEFVEKALEILADIILNSVFEEQEIIREKSVILEEIAQTEDTPDDIIFDNFFASIYPEQPFGRSILGTRENVKNFHSRDLKAFIENFYVAENILLVASGGISGEQIAGYTQKYFSGLSTKKNSIIFETPEYFCANLRTQRSLEQTHVIFGFPGVSYSKDFKKVLAAHIISIILGGSMSSKLFQEVREKRGLAYSISSFHSAYLDAGVFGIYSAMDPKNLEELSKVVFAEINGLAHIFTEDELNRAKKQIKSRLLMGMESNNARAESIAKDHQYFGHYLPIGNILEMLISISKEDIKNGIHEIFKAKQLSVAVLGDINKLPSYDLLVAMLD